MSIDVEIPAWAGPVAVEDIAASRGEARFTVAAAGWRDLPAELVDLVAPPVLVRASAVDEDEEEDEPLGPPLDEPCAQARLSWSPRRI